MEGCAPKSRHAGGHYVLGEAKNRFSPRTSEETAALPISPLQTLASRTVKEYIYAVVSHRQWLTRWQLVTVALGSRVTAFPF